MDVRLVAVGLCHTSIIASVAVNEDTSSADFLRTFDLYTFRAEKIDLLEADNADLQTTKVASITGKYYGSGQIDT